MKALPPEAVSDARKQHPVAWWSLLAATVAPMVLGITGLGFLFKNLLPSAGALVILAGGCVCIAAIAPLGLLGAFVWLLLARPFVPRSVAKAFYVHPGSGILSRLSAKMYRCIYGSADDPHGAEQK
jgi:hypothetical protein